MLASALLVGVLAAAASQPAGEAARKVTFDGQAALAGWTVTGEVAVDAAKQHDGHGSLKVAPGGKAVLKLRDTDESGKVEMWVYDDCTTPDAPKE